MQACFLLHRNKTMDLHLLEAPGNRKAGGVLCVFPSGARKQVAWESLGPIADPLGMGKQIAAAALDSCLREGRGDDADRTNWASAAAACTEMVRRWNARLAGPGALIFPPADLAPIREPEPDPRGRPKMDHTSLGQRVTEPPEPPPGLAELGSLAVACKLLEGVVAEGGGQFSGQGGHPPGAPSHREPKAVLGDSDTVANGPQTPLVEDDLF